MATMIGNIMTDTIVDFILIAILLNKHSVVNGPSPKAWQHTSVTG